jgi:hypothetical protein
MGIANRFTFSYLAAMTCRKLTSNLKSFYFMELKVNRIYLTAENSSEKNLDPKHGSTDVIVFLENGKKYIASFFAYENINEQRRKHQKNGNFLSGAYFWDKNMVLVEDCSMKFIEPIVKDIIDEGNFQEAFREL